MIKKVKTLFVLFVVGAGLSGCIVVPDDELYSSSYYSYSSYDLYPVGSYEWATDYYHRPPAPKHHHYKHHKSDYKYKKPVHDKHYEDKKHIDKKHEHDKHHDVHKNEIRKDRPSHDVPKNRPDKSRTSHDNVKQSHAQPLDRKNIEKHEHRPVNHKIFQRH